jgi:hypothetical protein
MRDAYQLLRLAQALSNTRVRGMRRELRARLGDALGVPERDQPLLDCIESQDVFVTILPKARIKRDDLADLSPLLRQAVVAACSAFETYVEDSALARVGQFLRGPETMTVNLAKLTMTLGDWVDIHTKYDREAWGVRSRVLRPYIRDKASTNPDALGQVLSAVGIKNWLAAVDKSRRVASGRSQCQLAEISGRRNLIVHAADKIGTTKRGQISVQQATDMINTLEGVAEAIEKLFAPIPAEPLPSVDLPTGVTDTPQTAQMIVANRPGKAGDSIPRATSVGSRGDSYDNELAESFSGLYKAELIHRQPWRVFDDVEYATLESP